MRLIAPPYIYKKNTMSSTRNLLLSSCIVISSCATIVSKSSYPVTIHSNPSKASVEVRDKKDLIVYKGTTPATMNLKAGAGFFSKARYIVHFKMDGYSDKTVAIEYKLNGWYFGNLLFGGVLGLLVVDPLTGAMWRIKKDFIDEQLDPVNQNTGIPRLEIRDINSLSAEMRQQLVRVN